MQLVFGFSSSLLLYILLWFAYSFLKMIEYTTIAEALHLKSLCMAESKGTYEFVKACVESNPMAWQDVCGAYWDELCSHFYYLARLAKYSWISPLSP